MNIRRSSILTGMALAASLMSQSAFAGDIFLDPGDSIQDAIDSSSSGDVIHLSPGTYNELINLNGRMVTIRGEGGALGTILSGEGLDGSVVTCDSAETLSTVLEDLCITNGTGTMSAGRRIGGGMRCNGASPMVRRCIFLGNTADNGFLAGGGAVDVYGGAPCFDGCKFMNNHTTYRGGACFLDDTEALFVSCLMQGNVADRAGGAIMSQANEGPVPTLAHCTLVANEAESSGAIDIDEGAAIIVRGSVIWGNMGLGGQIGGNSGGASVAWSNIEGGFGGTGNIDLDPQFIDAANGNYDLAEGSPCIDAGDSTAIPAGLDKDFGGGPRFCDDESVTDTGLSDGFRDVADMGCDERSSSVWTDLGLGLAGQGGLVPQLTGEGGLCAGDRMRLELTDTRPQSIAILFLGFSRIDLPFLGGTMVPEPEILFCCTPTDTNGSLILDFEVPDGDYPAATYFQYWMLDDAGPRGASASNGLQVSPQ